MESSKSTSHEPFEAPNVSDPALAHVPVSQQLTGTKNEAGRIMRYDQVRMLVVGEQAVQFTPLEYRLAQLLVDRVGGVVTYDELTQAAFGRSDGSTSRTALEKHLDRIRSKVRTLGLDLPGVTNYGCLLIWETVRRSPR